MTEVFSRYVSKDLFGVPEVLSGYAEGLFGVPEVLSGYAEGLFGLPEVSLGNRRDRSGCRVTAH